MNAGFFGLPWFAWAGISLAVAILYWFVWPQKKAAQTSGLRYFIVRYGHALVWLLLALNFLLRGISPALYGVANFAALAAGLGYLLFLGMSLPAKQ